MLSSLKHLAAASLLALAGMTGAAIAADDPATTVSAANLRSGPGTSFNVIVSLPKGTDVVAHACTQTWCAVTTEDDDEGFVAKSLLDFDVGDDSPPPSSGDEVCFYQGPNLTGPNFCVEPGDSDDQIPGSFNNAIESILVEGDASVDVCTGAGMNGNCATYDHSVKKLPASLRDKISSYAVDTGDNSDDGDSGDFSNDDGDLSITLN